MLRLLALFAAFACVASAQERPDVWPEPGTHVYVGYLGERAKRYPVQMTLRLPEEGAETVSGQYRYERSGLNLNLEGTLRAAGQLHLEERAESEGATGVFTGRVLNRAHRIEGTWRRIGGERPLALPFVLDLVAVEGATHMDVPGDFQLELSRPFFVRPNELTRAINQKLTERAAASRAEFESEWQELISDTQAQLRRGEDVDWRVAHSVDQRLAVYHASDRLVSVGGVVWMYTGGAHGNYALFGHTWVRRDGKVRELTLTDLLVDSASLAKLSAIVGQRLRRQGASWSEDMELDEMASFVLSPAGVVFAFDPYCVGPYAAGAFHVPVRWSEASGILKKPAELAGGR